MGRRPLGNDINPAERAHDTAPADGRQPSRTSRADLDRSRGAPATIDNPDLLVFYSEKTLQHICALRNWLLERAPLGRRCRPRGRLDQDGRDQPPDGSFAGILFDIHAAAESGGLGSVPEENQRARRHQTPVDRDVDQADPQEVAQCCWATDRWPPIQPPLLTTSPAHSTPADSRRLGDTGRHVAAVPGHRPVCRGQLDAKLVRRHRRRRVSRSRSTGPSPAWQNMVRATLARAGARGSPRRPCRVRGWRGPKWQGPS